MSQFEVGDTVKITVPGDYESQQPEPFYVDSTIDGLLGNVTEVIDPDDEYPLMSYDISFDSMKYPGTDISYEQVVPESWMSPA